jgi:hypothetical protein
MIFILLLSWFCSYRQPWLVRGMASGSAAEAVEAAEIPVLKGTEEDGLSQEVVPKYLIGKTQEELEQIVLSFGEVSFLMFLSMWKVFQILLYMVVESMRQRLGNSIS